MSQQSIVERARTGWGIGNVPYDMFSYDTPTGHRADCSGFASMTLGLPAPGLSTVTLVTENVITQIDPNAAIPGDFIAKAGPGTEGAVGHIVVITEIRQLSRDRVAYVIIEQAGGEVGPLPDTWTLIPDGYYFYAATFNEPEDIPMLEIVRDRNGVMWACQDRLSRRALIDDDDVRYFLGRGAGVPAQPATASNGAPCVERIEAYGAVVDYSTQPAPAVLTAEQMTALIAEVRAGLDGATFTGTVTYDDSDGGDVGV